VSGLVRDQEGKPIGGASLDVWQTSSDGFYDIQDDRQPEMNLRGQFTTGADGCFFFRTIKPSSYPIPSDGTVGQMLRALGRHPMRPAHIHFIVSARGFEPVTTHVFVEGDEYLDSDAVFGVKQSLIIPFVRRDNAREAERVGVANPFYTAQYDFTLVRARRARAINQGEREVAE
jgi:protocatechuate 3,4-dioxygenase beta subunit